MQAKAIPSKGKPPQQLLFPDGQEKELKTWRDLLLAVVDWKRRQLAAHVPIVRPSTGRILVARDGAQMKAPRNVGGYWVETHASALYLVKTANHVLKALGEDPARLHVVLR